MERRKRSGDSKKPVKKPAVTGQQPASKEDAIKQMIEKDPQRAAQLLKEILKNK